MLESKLKQKNKALGTKIKNIELIILGIKKGRKYKI